MTSSNFVDIASMSKTIDKPGDYYVSFSTTWSSTTWDINNYLSIALNRVTVNRTKRKVRNVKSYEQRVIHSQCLLEDLEIGDVITSKEDCNTNHWGEKQNEYVNLCKRNNWTEPST